MKRRIICFAVAAGLGACTTFSDIESGMNARMGQPVSTLINDLGFPTREVNIAGRKAYVWSTSRSVNTLQQTTGFGGVPTLVTGPAVEYECEITVEVDQNDIMRDWSSEGNIGGCQRYANALN